MLLVVLAAADIKDDRLTKGKPPKVHIPREAAEGRKDDHVSQRSRLRFSPLAD